MSSNSSRPAVEGRGVSRRTLVKGAAHAAWVVPAVQVVSAVPAFAASGCAITATIGALDYKANGQLNVPITFTNAGPAPVEQITITITTTGTSSTTHRSGDSGVPGGWTKVPNVSTVSFTASGQPLLGVNSPTPWTFGVNAPRIGAVNTASVSVSIVAKSAAGAKPQCSSNTPTKSF